MGQDRADEVLSTIPPHPVRFPFALGLLTILLLCSVALLVTGIAMFALDTAPVLVRLLAVIAGGGLTGWFGWLLSRGAGRHTPVISSSTPMHVTSIAAFGLPMGFSLFQLLTIDQSPVTIGMFVASAAGLAATLVAFVRDADLLDVPIELVVLPSAAGEQRDGSAPAVEPSSHLVPRFSDVAGEPADEVPGFVAPVDEAAFAPESEPADQTAAHGFSPSGAEAFFASDLPSETTARRRAVVEDEDEEPAAAPPRRAARRAAPED